MAHTLSGAHNIRKNSKRRLRNKAVKTELRSQIKKVLAAIQGQDKKVSAEELKAAYSLLDRAATQGVIHSNSAARHKSRLAAKVLAQK